MTEVSCKELFNKFLECGGTIDCDYISKKCKYYNEIIPEEKMNIIENWNIPTYEKHQSFLYSLYKYNYFPRLFTSEFTNPILSCNMNARDNDLRVEMNKLLWYSGINPGCKIKDYHKLGIGHFRLKELNREYFRIGFHNYQEEDSTRCIIWQKDPYKK
jgi:hypothetical protein